MKKIHHYHRRFRLSLIRAGMLTVIACIFLMPSYVKFEKTGDNYFTVSINGETVGAIGSESDLDHCLMQARKQVASGSDDLVFIDVQPQVEGKEVIWGVIDDEDTLINRIAQVMSANIQKTLRRSYTCLLYTSGNIYRSRGFYHIKKIFSNWIYGKFCKTICRESCTGVRTYCPDCRQRSVYCGSRKWK